MPRIEKIVECVANISHGIQNHKLEEIIETIQEVRDQKLLDVDNSPSANRSVLTFAGQPEQVFEAAFRLFKNATALIDMRSHKGNHPRIGAVDVCPFVPLQKCSKAEIIMMTDDLAKRVANSLHVPVYLYELSAKSSTRRNLPDIRRGGYESLPNKMLKSQWLPDYGPLIQSKYKESILRTGASVIGCRKILVAFNISLDTSSLAIAKRIAYRIRKSGWSEKIQRTQEKTCSEYPYLRAIGWFSTDYNCAQVSCNFLRYHITSPLTVWEKVKELAKEYGIRAIGCEVIGLIPEHCVLEAGMHASQLKNKPSERELPTIIQMGIDHFCFNAVRPFDPKHKILDYRLKEIKY